MDKGLKRISQACFGHLVKMLINIEPHGISISNFAYLFILTLSKNWYAKRLRGFAEHHFG